MKLLVHTFRVVLTLVFSLMALAGVVALNSGKINGPYTFSLFWTLTSVSGIGLLGMVIASQTSTPARWYLANALGAILLFPLLLTANFHLGQFLGYQGREDVLDRHYAKLPHSTVDWADIRQQTRDLRSQRPNTDWSRPQDSSGPPPPPPALPTAPTPPSPKPARDAPTFSGPPLRDTVPSDTPPAQPRAPIVAEAPAAKTHDPVVDFFKRPAPTKTKEPVYIPPAGQPGTPTELVGGPEGWQFEAYDHNRRAVVGFRYRMGSWAGTPAVARFDPLYDRRQPATSDSMAIGREGYVVGGLHVVAGDLVNAVRIIFVRQQSGGSLDKSDFYLSDWIGEPGENKPKVLGDGQTRIIGICGRNGAVKNAIALILDKP